MIDPASWLQWAQYYASQGYAVLPLVGKEPAPRPDGARKPKGDPIRLGAYDASSDPRVWDYWLRRYGACNIGIAVPRGKIAIDVDPRHGGDVDFERLERERGECFAVGVAASQRTGGGGWHFLFDAPPDQRYPGGKLEGCLGLDVKQHGGYLVAAPSVHPDTGKRYEFTPARAAGPVPAPSWVSRRYVAESASRVSAASDVDETRRADARFGMTAERAVRDVSDDAIVAALRAVADIYVQGQKHHVRVKMGSILNRLGWSRDSVERFGYALCATFGGDNADKIAGETVRGMAYPSGYYDLVAMAPPGRRDALAAALDAIPNPWGDELRASRALAREQIQAALGQPPTQPTPTVAAPSLGVAPAGPAATVGPAPVPLLEAIAGQVNSLSALGKVHDVHAPAPPLRYCVQGLPWHFDALNAISGFANTGKSPFTASLIVALNAGIPFHGRATVKGRVLVLVFEAARSMLRHIQRHARAVAAPISNIDLIECNAGAMGDDPAYVATLRRIASQYDYVFVDTYNAANASLEVRDSKFAQAAKHLEFEGVATFVVLHTTKADEEAPTLKSISGSGAIAGAVKAAVGLWRPKGCDDGFTFEAVCVRTPDKTFAPIRFKMADTADGAGWVYQPVEVKRDSVDESEETQAQTVARYVNAIPSLYEGKPAHHRIRYSELKAALRASNGELVRRACKELVDLGALVVDKKRGNDLGWLHWGTPRDHHDAGTMPATPVVARDPTVGVAPLVVPGLPTGPGFSATEKPTPEQKNE